MKTIRYRSGEPLRRPQSRATQGGWCLESHPCAQNAQGWGTRVHVLVRRHQSHGQEQDQGQRARAPALHKLHLFWHQFGHGQLVGFSQFWEQPRPGGDHQQRSYSSEDNCGNGSEPLGG